MTPADKFNAYINFDYGHENPSVGPGSTQWWGIAGAAKFQFDDHNALTPRVEYFNDTDGFAGFGAKLKEFTITYEYKWTKGLLSRIEYRHDWSDLPVFEKNRSSIPGGGPPSHHQDIDTVAIIAYFRPH